MNFHVHDVHHSHNFVVVDDVNTVDDAVVHDAHDDVQNGKELHKEFFESLEKALALLSELEQALYKVLSESLVFLQGMELFGSQDDPQEYKLEPFEF